MPAATHPLLFDRFAHVFGASRGIGVGENSLRDHAETNRAPSSPDGQWECVGVLLCPQTQPHWWSVGWYDSRFSFWVDLGKEEGGYRHWIRSDNPLSVARPEFIPWSELPKELRAIARQERAGGQQPKLSQWGSGEPLPQLVQRAAAAPGLTQRLRNLCRRFAGQQVPS
jgi:hypothetical protein